MKFRNRWNWSRLLVEKVWGESYPWGGRNQERPHRADGVLSRSGVNYSGMSIPSVVEPHMQNPHALLCACHTL